MDNILPNSGTYKVNARVNDISMDDCSIIGIKDDIQPYFEEEVSDDPDVTGLMIYLKNSRGEIAGWKVIYTLAAGTGTGSGSAQNGNNSTNGNTSTQQQNQNGSQTETQNNVQGSAPVSTPNDAIESDGETEEESSTEEEIALLPENADDTELTENADDPEEEISEPPRQSTAQYKNGDEFIITVDSLDDDLPFFPIPDDLPNGWYVLVSNVMSGRDILQKTEKSFYFLADAVFSFESIQAHLPGTAENSQLIPNGTVIMLEAILKYDRQLSPYVVWYSGKKKVAEGNFSEGFGNLLWTVPEQNGFFSLHAEIFPVEPRQGMTGYTNDISLLVSSKAPYLHLVPEDVPALIHWYTFEGALEDSKAKTSEEYAIKSAGKNTAQWMPANGIFGLVTGSDNAFTLPGVSISDSETNTWQVLFRFKPLINGKIFAVQFKNSDVVLNLSKENNKLILSLVSSSETVSESFILPEPNALTTADIVFSVLPQEITAKLNIHSAAENLSNKNLLSSKQISLEAKLDGEYTITLGYQPIVNTANINQNNTAAQRPTFTAFWDELALFSMPLVEVETETVDETEEQEIPQVEAEELSESGDESAV